MQWQRRQLAAQLQGLLCSPAPQTLRLKRPGADAQLDHCDLQKQSNAIDRTWCQEERKIHDFLCLLVQKVLLGYGIKLRSTEEHRERQQQEGEPEQFPAHAAPRHITGAISPSSLLSKSPGEHRDTKAGTIQIKDAEEGIPWYPAWDPPRAIPVEPQSCYWLGLGAQGCNRLAFIGLLNLSRIPLTYSRALA